MSNEGQIGVGIGVLLVNEKGQFLLMKRNSKHATGTYAMPGGWLEFGENFEQTAARELKEELDVDVSKVEVLGVTNNLFPKESKHTVAIIVGAVLKSGEPRIMEPRKCESIKWYDDWDKLPSPLFTDYNEYMSEDVVKAFLDKAKNI